MNVSSVVRFWCCTFLAASFCGHAFELSTHAAMAASAAQRSVMSDPKFSERLGFDLYGGEFGGTFFDFDDAGTTYTRYAHTFETGRFPGFAPIAGTAPPFENAQAWLMRGSVREDDGNDSFYISSFHKAGEPLDDPFTNFLRYCHHFFDPIYVRGLTTICSTDTHQPNPNWAIGTSDAFATPLARLAGHRNHQSLFAAREAMYRALTLRNGSGVELDQNLPPSARFAARKAYWASTFRALGHLIHLVQDMGQPQHTRDEGHGFGHAATFERYLDARARQERSFAVDGLTLTQQQGTLRPLKYDYTGVGDPGRYPVPAFATFADYWSSARGSVPRNVSSGKGLADYTNRGFLTPGTALGTGTSLYNEPPRSVGLYAQIQEPGICDGPTTPGQGVVYLSRDVTDSFSPAHSRPARLQTKGSWGISSDPRFLMNHCVFDDVAELVIPRAVAYSVGLVDHFFRGKLQIELPPEGLYAVIDHNDSTANNPLTGGFPKLKARIRNKTTYQAVAGGPEIPESAPVGHLRAVIRFHRNNCYADDLSGEYGSPGKSWQGCRNSEEEIVVSNPVAVTSALDKRDEVVILDGQEVTVLGGQVATFEFPTRIPISGSDMRLQVVYRGQLGEDPDAVVVETKDISEPTYAYNFVVFDQFRYEHYASFEVNHDRYGPELWCQQGEYPTTDQCYEAQGLTIAFQASPDASPILGYDPNNPIVPPNQWQYYTIIPPSDTRPPFSPYAKLVSPAGKFTRIAVLMDAVPQNMVLVMQDQVDEFKNRGMYQWYSGIPQAARNQLENGMLVPSVTWVSGRGIYVPEGDGLRLNAFSPGITIPNLVRVPSIVNF